MGTNSNCHESSYNEPGRARLDLASYLTFSLFCTLIPHLLVHTVVPLCVTGWAESKPNRSELQKPADRPQAGERRVTLPSSASRHWAGSHALSTFPSFSTPILVTFSTNYLHSSRSKSWSAMSSCRSSTLAKLKRLLIILMLIRIIRSRPLHQKQYTYSLPPVIFHTVSPLFLHAPLSAVEIMTAPLAPEIGMLSASASPKPNQLKRVLSHGSNGSAAISTPTNGHAPLSPSSGGVRTPKASGKGLPPTDHPDGRKDGEKLATDLHQLKVQSPTMTNQGLPSISQQAIDIPAPRSDVGRGGHVPAHRQESNNSTSTEGSSNHPYPPSSLGTSYGPEGFPRTTTPGEDITMDPYKSVQAMAAVAAADEAIKQINGTATVRHAPSLMGVGAENPFQLPRGYANFVNPQYRDRPQSPPDYSASRQSSTSSTTTEASTSSEESDLCIPSIEWVQTKPTNLASLSNPGHSPYQYTPYMPNAVPQVRPRSPVPPPRPAHQAIHNGKAVASPRRPSGINGNGHGDAKPSIPLGATAHSPGGTSSAMPLGMPVDEPAEDDDDEQTVGHNRSRSRSRSTSSESGLDLLSHVASGDQNTQAGSSGQHHDGKGKRKAGTQAVAQWRESGIPIGVDKKTGPRRSSGQAGKATASSSHHQATPPRKRRRSEMSDANIDPLLRADRGDSAMDVEDALATDGSDEEEEVNSGDSEYGASSRAKPRTSRGRGGRKAGVTRGRTSVGSAKAAPKKTKKTSGSPPGSNRRASTSASANANAAGGVQCEYINPLPVSTFQTRLSHTRLTSQPYNRCTDVFTRKYDLPRHMARHARREGELVMEGKLAEDRAALWKTIKDKPKVTCTKCGESFTR